MEPSPTKSLRDLCQEIAGRFLQTVVVVDDQASFGSTDSPDSAPIKSADITNASPVVPAAGLVAPTAASTVVSHELDAKTLIDAFAKSGLVCAILKSGQAGDDQEVTKVAALSAARRADIIVMDWVVDGQYGEMALDLIRRILDEDKPSERLRLLAVYTAEADLRGITDKVTEALEPFYTSRQLERHGDFEASKGPAKIIVLAKQTAQIPQEDPELHARVVDDADLPAALISAFAEMIHGLLPAFSVAGLAALRAQSYTLVSRFTAELDPAYLGHRVLLSDPDDAEEQLVSILAAELHSILEDADIKSCLAAPAILVWLDSLNVAGTDVRNNLPKKPTADGILKDLVSKGLTDSSVRSLSGVGKDKQRQLATQIFLPAGATNDEDLNVRLAILMSQKTRYGSPPRELCLGTIVALDQDGKTKYFLCIQPKCDSIRLSEATSFPFLI